jgi:alpha-ketoglutarate-dependent 2,4-dichlorophenoxyacetate dioxygenase
MIEVKQLHPLFVGEASGVDLRKPVDAETVRAIVAAADKYAVLVFRGQAIDDEQQIAFSRHLGPLETTIRVLRKDCEVRLNPHVSDISNLDEKSRVLEAQDRRRMNGLANRLWHTDSSFKRVPARYSLLSARVIPPEGGETEFADLRCAAGEEKGRAGRLGRGAFDHLFARDHRLRRLQRRRARGPSGRAAAHRAAASRLRP